MTFVIYNIIGILFALNGILSGQMERSIINKYPDYKSRSNAGKFELGFCVTVFAIILWPIAAYISIRNIINRIL